MANRWWGKPSEFPWEQAALEHIREKFPTTGNYRAWAGFTFTARNQRIRECDLFAVTPTGAYLVEIKSHPGRATNRGSDWTFTDRNGRRRTFSNPLHLTDLKAKELKNRLRWAAQELGLDVQVPFIEAGVFLSDPGLRCAFDEVQKANVYGRNGLEKQTGLPGVSDGLIDTPHSRVDPRFLRHVTRLMEKIGIMPMDRALQLGEYTLEKRSFDSGPTWTDFKAEHQRLGGMSRVRLFHYGENPSEDELRSVERAAKREYMSLEGISHEGIVKAEYFGLIDEGGADLGPAIAFRHHKSWQRLDHFIAEHGEGLDVDTRMVMVRQLAEAVNHAHRNRLYHRALAARSVWVEMDGNYPRLYIADWQVAARESLRLRGNRTSHVSSSGGATEHLESALGKRALAAHVERAAEVYLAPEFPDFAGRAAAQDLFGLGALTYLVFTGRPPARNRAELSQAIQEHGCLTPAAVSDDIVPQLDTLVRESTQRSPNDRLATVQAFLRMLDEVEERLTLPEVTTDPLVARTGDEITPGWEVREVLGKGATSRALLMRNERTGREVVYKVALNTDAAAAALRSEAQTLRAVGSHPRIVSMDSAEKDADPGLQEIGERTVLVLQRAGQQTLAEFLGKEGALTSGELDAFGRHLFEIFEYLGEKEILHRDIKPANLGVREIPKQARSLMLFDFSLARAPLTHTSSGTRGYLDPFLGEKRPYDEFAERYALAVTLHEMVTGELPVWDEEGIDPEFLAEDVQVPRLAEEAFPKQSRDALVSFFHRSLHRRSEERFATLAEMRTAWQASFLAKSAAESPVEDEKTRRRNQESATVDTPLHLSGLTPLAVDTAQRILRCETVGQLLRKPVRSITHMRGSTRSIRNELSSATAYWRKHLDVAEYAVPAKAKLPSGADDKVKRNALLDQVIRQLLPNTTDANRWWVRVARELLGMPEGRQGFLDWWPTRREIARRLELPAERVEEALQEAFAYWGKNASLLGSVRDDVVEILDDNNRLREVRQIASELLATRGSTLETEERSVYALATVRAVVEFEEQRSEQRFVARRYPRRVMVAQVIDNDPLVPVEGDLFDYAEALGERADELVALDGSDALPGPRTVREVLRGAEAPEGMKKFSDTDLVQLAAAASERAEATPRLELYPVDLDLERALRITQAIGYLGKPGITPEQIRDRVRSRFPALPEPSRKQLYALLKSRHPKLREERVNDTVCWYLEPEFTTYQPSTHTGHHSAPDQVDTASLQAWQRLEQAVQRGGYRALKTWLPDTERSAQMLTRVPGAVPFDVSTEFVRVVDEVMDAKGRGLTWDHLAKADNSQPRPRPFETLLQEVFQHLGDRIRTASADSPTGQGVVVLYRATPLARYDAGRALLGRLIQEAREANRAPYGLWILCPMRGPQAPATLDGHPAGIIADSEQVLLPRGFSAPEATLVS
ncbi:BREX system serine/threonine kinase PglW [Nocardiopsis nanhaiensis]